MQEPRGGAGGAVGGGEEEGEHSGRNSPRAPEEQRRSGRSSADEGPNDDDDVREPRGPQDPGNGAAAGNADEAPPPPPPPGEQPPLAFGPGGDAAGACRSRPRNRLLEFSVTVPFRSPLEAQAARRSLISNARRQQMMVQQEFTVDNSTLSVRWTAEDPILFRISINNFLDQLFLVMRNIQHLQWVEGAKRGRGSRPDF
uniref:EKC/KEOPS complex subunit LAGE3-like n=1 Tax=Jaculus jaculus TaxID=51337 RepID=UPI001E1B51E5|nr:EKC/KEOPS complex subunit LAGE3-like [Jaculus jaculus]